MKITLEVLDAIDFVESKGCKVLTPLEVGFVPRPQGSRLGAVIDTETVGKAPLDATTKLIELGIVVFSYDPVSLRIYGPVAELSQYVDPGIPIPEETTLLTGITDDMVRGLTLNKDDIAHMLEDVDLIIAHNVSFDRPIVEREIGLEIFKSLPWVCSIKDINWMKLGLNGAKLEYLAMMSGFHYVAHRASTDCFAVINLLQVRDVFKELYAAKDKVSYQIWAIGDTFAFKDVLKSKGFVFDAGSATSSKGWVITCEESEYAYWVNWLMDNVYRKESVRLPVRKIDRTQWHSLSAPTAQMRLLDRANTPSESYLQMVDLLDIFEEPPH